MCKYSATHNSPFITTNRLMKLYAMTVTVFSIFISLKSLSTRHLSLMYAAPRTSCASIHLCGFIRLFIF